MAVSSNSIYQIVYVRFNLLAHDDRLCDETDASLIVAPCKNYRSACRNGDHSLILLMAFWRASSLLDTAIAMATPSVRRLSVVCLLHQ